MTFTDPKFTVTPSTMDSETMLIVFSVVDNGGYGVLLEEWRHIPEDGFCATVEVQWIQFEDVFVGEK